MFKLDALKNFKKYWNLKREEVEKEYRIIVFTPEQAESLTTEKPALETKIIKMRTFLTTIEVVSC